MFSRSIGLLTRSSLLRSQTLLSKLPLNRTTPSTFFKQSAMTLITISQSLDEAYTKSKVVPEVVDQFDTQGLLSIEYGPTELVTLGNTLSVEGTQKIPKFN